MAPVRKKRVWNFSFDADSESPPARRKRRLVNAATCARVIKQRRAVEMLVEADAESAIRALSLAAWQKLLFVPALSKTDCEERIPILENALDEKTALLAKLLQLYKLVGRKIQNQQQQQEQQLAAFDTLSVKKLYRMPSISYVPILHTPPPSPPLPQAPLSPLVPSNDEKISLKEIEAEIAQHEYCIEKAEEFLNEAYNYFEEIKQ